MKNLNISKSFFNFVLSEGMIEKTICIFPGRFQPFGPHHFQIWRFLTDKFGRENVYIATSNVVSEDSPFSFSEKAEIITQFGIPKNQIVQVKNPYKSEEITSNFNPTTTSVVFAYGEKDYGRLSFTKKDGTPGYFTEYRGKIEYPLSERGYAYKIPNVLNSDDSIKSSTDLRNFLEDATYEEFAERFGHTYKKVWPLLKSKFIKKQNMKEIFENLIRSQARGKHLQHPWEDEDLSYADLHELISMTCENRLENVTEKVDGQNLMVTVHEGQILYARNKTQIKNPVSAAELLTGFKHLPHVEVAFREATDDLNMLFSHQPRSILNEFFHRNKFLNMEVIHPSSVNVIRYGNRPKFVFHSINEYDEFGTELGRNLNFERFIIPSKFMKFEVVRPNVSLNVPTGKKTEYISKLNKLWDKYGLKLNSTLGDLYAVINPNLKHITSMKQREKEVRQCYAAVEPLFLNLGAMVLNTATGFISDETPNTYIAQTQQIRKQADQENNREVIQKLNRQFMRLDAIDYPPVPSEGIVFSFKGNLYKYTGHFGPINQILGIYRYSR